jgi:hypothetical protein
MRGLTWRHSSKTGGLFIAPLLAVLILPRYSDKCTVKYGDVSSHNRGPLDRRDMKTFTPCRGFRRAPVKRLPGRLRLRGRCDCETGPRIGRRVANFDHSVEVFLAAHLNCGHCWSWTVPAFLGPHVGSTRKTHRKTRRKALPSSAPNARQVVDETDQK